MKKIIYLLISVLILFTVIIGDFALGSENQMIMPGIVLLNILCMVTRIIFPIWIYGLWRNTGTWQIKPLLNYERYPDLEPVEASVKEGEYEQAEYELLQYYREIKYQRSVPINSVSNEDITAADLLGKNFYFVQYNGAIVDTFNVENDWTEVSVNVTDSIKKAQGIEQYRTFMINSVSRTSIAEFMTKEGGHAPILRLNVNGAAREIPACRDTYIAAGTLANVNYGNETIMLASESGTVYNHDDGTKRPYVTFDISSLKSTDVISSASLLLQGRNISDTGTKEMVLYQYNDSNWDEGTLTWDTFTEHYTFSLNDQDSWDYITSASPSIKGKICFLHRGGILNIPGQLWDYTKDEQYAYTFLRQQMALVNHVGVNTNVMNPIDMATHLNAASRNVLQTVDSEYMSPEIFTALMKHFT